MSYPECSSQGILGRKSVYPKGLMHDSMAGDILLA